MAAKLVLKNGKLPHIWNVSSRVGPGSDEPNNGTDVELLNTLVVIAMGHPAIKRFGIKGNAITPNRATVFDPILGFWIFRFQQIGKHPASDGVASPARGTSFAPGQPWVVVTINEFAPQSQHECECRIAGRTVSLKRDGRPEPSIRGWRRLASLASKDGLLATIGAASINPAAVPGHSKLADHEDVL